MHLSGFVVILTVAANLKFTSFSFYRYLLRFIHFYFFRDSFEGLTGSIIDSTKGPTASGRHCTRLMKKDYFIEKIEKRF